MKSDCVYLEKQKKDLENLPKKFKSIASFLDDKFNESILSENISA